MSAASESRTSPTLLGLLRRDPTDQAAWARFVDRYGPAIYRWCRQYRLQEADAEDVTQAVLLRLAKKMYDFAYDPTKSFRRWLRTLTQHALSDFWQAQQKTGRGSGDNGAQEWLDTVEARQDLAARLEDEYDQELLEAAIARVRLRVAPHRWELFRLMAMDGLSGAEAAAKVGMPVATAYSVRHKVQAILTEELRRLDITPDPTSEEHR
jgi:RNA polymerase sigma-70 factor (ECF subfamily)